MKKADAFDAWLGGPPVATLSLRVSHLTYEQGVPTVHVPTVITVGGEVQLTDTQQVTLAVAAQDSKGYPTTDANLTWSSADTTIVALQPSDDGMSCLCVAGAPGLGVVVTVSDGDRSATESFDVVAGGTATLQISEGAPEDQPPSQ